MIIYFGIILIISLLLLIYIKKNPNAEPIYLICILVAFELTGLLIIVCYIIDVLYKWIYSIFHE